MEHNIDIILNYSAYALLNNLYITRSRGFIFCIVYVCCLYHSRPKTCTENRVLFFDMKMVCTGLTKSVDIIQCAHELANLQITFN